MRLKHALPIGAVFAVFAAVTAANGAAQDGVSVEAARAAAESAVKPVPGQYESQNELVDFQADGIPANMKGMMRNAMSSAFAQNNSFCVTPEEAEQGASRMIEELAQNDCTLNKFDVDGGSIDADLTCRNDGGEGNITMVGTMTPESSDIVMTVDQSMPEMGNMLIKVNMKARRVGECSGAK
ncbi:hypothetical protein FHS61_001581 [Altererythrobacter atlanticus]|uniref:Uncharacterized protein n=1 Tax=Croceibacterium atlanticum TaxID=1267766 RepID=A0A0F7KYD8_9SPHN|nr:DUF3617 domain-containing protein [Croceibacterium atlanticum]AKH44261.1 hypothetical protein WYH_03242 [Croceibacterium atlanticum]MBB5732572.1 hypothetical protein [Croceibacterium atlanticum]